MGTIKVEDGTEIYFTDWGEGQPVVFSHGWPLSADAYGYGYNRPILLKNSGVAAVVVR